MYNESKQPEISSNLQPNPWIRQRAATKISKVIRGHKVRKQLPEIIEEYDRQQLELINKVNEIEQRANKMSDAAIKIQSAARNRKALKELYRREDTNEALNTILDNTMSKVKERQSAGKTIKSAWKGHKARQEIYEKAHNFNPEGYQDLLRANIKKYKSVESEHRTRNTQPQEKLNKAARHIASIKPLIQKKSAAGRPEGSFLNPRLSSGGNSSRLSMLSTTSTQAAMTPKKK